jgi:chromosome segregation ATPase
MMALTVKEKALLKGIIDKAETDKAAQDEAWQTIYKQIQDLQNQITLITRKEKDMLQVITDIQTALNTLAAAVTALEGKVLSADDSAALDAIKAQIATIQGTIPTT